MTDHRRNARPRGLTPWTLAKRKDIDGRVMWMRLFERPDGSRFVKDGPVVWTPPGQVGMSVTTSTGPPVISMWWRSMWVVGA